MDSVRRIVSLRRLRVGGMAAVLAMSALVTGTTPAMAWAPGSFSASDEALLFTLTNQDRASAGLPALTNDSYLHKEAEWRSKDMGDRNYFSHKIPPSNSMVFADMQKDHYCFKVAGENIGLSTFGDDAATTRIEKAFMASAGHRANILGKWSRMGVGAYKAADGRKLYTVLFSVPCSSKAKATPKPAAKATTATKTTPKPTATVTASPTPSPTPAPSQAPEPTPTATPTPTPTPTAAPAAQGGAPAPTTLRIREKATSDSPLDSFLKLLGSIFPN